MPNTRSALKAMRRAERRRERNKPIRTGVKTRIKKVLQQLAVGNLETARALAVQAQSALDKAAQKGVIHRNNAARRKSRLMRRLNKALAQAGASAASVPAPATDRGS